MLSILFTLAVLATTPDPQAPAAGITGAASPLLESFCVSADVEDGGVLRCSGLVGTDVFLHGDESSRTVSLGSAAQAFPPFPVPSALGRTLSWRILGDRPLAGILRYHFAEDKTQILAVVKAGSEERPGCLVAIVEDTGDDAATVAADRIADEKAAGFRCGVDRPTFEGRGSEFTGRVILPWLATQAP